MNRMRIHAMMMTVIAAALISLPAFADDFPGKGSRAAWEKAARLSNEAARLAGLGRVDDAIKAWRLAAQIYPDEPGFYFNCAVMLASKKCQYVEAHKCIDKAIALAPNRFTYRWERAQILIDQGKLRDAYKELSVARSLKKSAEQQKELDEQMRELRSEMK